MNAKPPLSARLVVALAFGIYGAQLIRHQYQRVVHTDFGMVWYGARAMLHHQDPYVLIGPGLPFDYGWHLIYPATALAAVSPLAGFSESTAATIFVGLSTFLLALGVTRDGWFLLPIFATEAFASSARLGQWSILFTAALFFPTLAFFSIAKPQAALPVLATSTCWLSIKRSAIGALILLAASTAFLPDWIHGWVANMRATHFMDAPVTEFAGVFTLLLLCRWRRPEAWLVLTLAFMPQSWGWYGTLPLFAVPGSFLESAALVVFSSCVSFFAATILPAGLSDREFHSFLAQTLIISTYIPATILVLLRPNKGVGPVWI
ncbi:MAG: hypothetical protein ABR582_14890, partial [Gemmatimonadaceae bacterium]